MSPNGQFFHYLCLIKLSFCSNSLLLLLLFILHLTYHTPSSRARRIHNIFVKQARRWLFNYVPHFDGTDICSNYKYYDLKIKSKRSRRPFCRIIASIRFLIFDNQTYTLFISKGRSGRCCGLVAKSICRKSFLIHLSSLLRWIDFIDFLILYIIFEPFFAVV